MDDYDVNSRKSIYREMKKTYTAEDIIEYLQRRAKLLGRTPRVKDINLDKDGPGKACIEKLFFSYDEAILAAGLEPLPRPWSSYGDDELIDILQKWCESHPGVTMTCSLLAHNPELPPDQLIRQRFGNIRGWFKASGCEYAESKSPWRKWAKNTSQVS